MRGIFRCLVCVNMIGYSGYFTLEADAYLKDYTSENIFEGIMKMADSAKRLAKMYEK